METFNLFTLKETLGKDGVLLCFAGPFSHSIIEELGNALKRYLEIEHLTKASLMDVFSVFIEQTQNIRNYAEQKAAGGCSDHDFNTGIVLIGKNNDHYVVSSGNIVGKEDVRDTLALLEKLKSLDKQGLKALYKEQMRKGPEEGRLGAGLGFIDMSRKSCEPLRYSIRDIDENYCFFSLRVAIAGIS